MTTMMMNSPAKRATAARAPASAPGAGNAPAPADRGRVPQFCGGGCGPPLYHTTPDHRRPAASGPAEDDPLAALER